MDTEDKSANRKSSKGSAKEPETFGVVAITEKTPATPDRFSFWARDDEQIPLEPGRLVTAQHPQEPSSQAIGIVDSLYATRDIGTPLDSYYSHGYGNPDQELATRQDLVRVAGVEVIRRTDGKNQPVSGSWPVRFSTAPEIIAAYGADVKPDKQMLGGFALDAYDEPVPIHLDSRFVLGYESAHINISGASGLATKTSYALFLIYAALAYSKKDKGQRVAAVAFNVKESDLLRIAKLPGKGAGDEADWAECWKLLDQKFGTDAEYQKKLWTAARENGIDPYGLVINKKLRFFAPASKDDANKSSISAPAGATLVPFYHGLGDFSRSGDAASLEVMFEAEDLDDKLTSVLYSTIDWLQSDAGKAMTFEKCFSELWKRVGAEGKGSTVSLGNSSVHKDTLNRFVRRLQHAVTHQLKGVVSQKDRDGKPVPVEQLKPDELWVIEISRLHDKGQRMVFLSVIDRISRLLEAKRNRESKALIDGVEVDIKDFPDKVVVFVDELNKFAPARVQRAPLRSRIVEITARGRSYGLSLIGAEQLASQIEEQVLVNTSTFAVGRTHSLEIGGRTYEWLREGLKQRAQTLQKGEMFLWHAVHARPALINFPVPLHMLLDE